MYEKVYKKTTFDHYVYVKMIYDDNFIIMLLYVDDMHIIGIDVSKIDRLKKQLGESFFMKGMEASKYILVIRIIYNKEKKKF